jgi:hypothetical protein
LLENHPEVILLDKQMVWSPASCEVNVNLPSGGPSVFTTVWPVSTSCEEIWFNEREMRVKWRASEWMRTATATYKDLDIHAQIFVLHVLPTLRIPFQSLIVT